MRKRILSFLLAACLIFSFVPAVSAAEAPVTVTVPGVRDYTQAQEVAALTNEQRAANGAGELAHNATLNALAMQRAAEIAIYFAHERPDGSSCDTVADGIYTGWSTFGENIAIGYGSPEAVMDGWMNSQGHRENILQTAFTQIGVGCFLADGFWCWVQLFGNSRTDTAVTDLTGTAVENVPVNTLPSRLSLNLGGTTDVALEPGQSVSFTIRTANFASDSFTAALVPQIRDAVDESGRVIARVSLASDGSGKVTVTAENPGTGSVSFPVCDGQANPYTMKITVAGQSEQPPVTEPDGNPFTDVPKGAYYYDAVLWAVENGITSGTTKTTFAPNATCTREQIVTFLWRALGKPQPQSNLNPFTDVKAGDYSYTAILWAVENGVTSGTGGGKFSPKAPCTRAQVATFLWRACGKPSAAQGANPFSDVPAGAYYTEAVLWAVENGITSGTGDGKFSPDAPCTRGQIVSFLYRTFA